MSHSLLLYLAYYPEKTVDWAIFDKTGQLIDSAIKVPLNSVPIDHSPIFVLISGTSVLLTQIAVSNKQRQHILQALPFALEEELAENIENLHFAVANKEEKSEKIAVAVIARTVMENIIQQLQSVNIKTTFITPDFLALHESEKIWHILYYENKVLVCTGQYAGFSIEKDNLLTFLETSLQESIAEMPQQLLVSTDEISISHIHELQRLNLPIKVKNYIGSPLAIFAQGLAHKTSLLNLLQGDYKPVSKTTNTWKRWRLTALLLLALGCIQLIQQGIAYHQLKQQRTSLNAQIEQLYQRTFPDARKIINPRVQMEQQLKNLRKQRNEGKTEENFLFLLNRISIPLRQAKGLAIQRMDYQNGQLDIQLEVADWQTWEYLKRKLEALNLSVEKQSATSTSTAVQSHLRIQKK